MQPDAAQKDAWFRATLSDFAWRTNSLDEAELADWIDEIVDAEFNCIFEVCNNDLESSFYLHSLKDGTIEVTANVLLEIRRHLSTGQADAAEAVVTQVETAARVYQPSSSRVEVQHSESEGEEEMETGSNDGTCFC